MPPKKALATAINPGKIEDIAFLLNRVESKHPDFKIPKYALLIGAGCSLQCGIPLGSDIVALCQMHSYLRDKVPGSSKLLENCRTKKAEIEKNITAAGKWADFEAYVKAKEDVLAKKVEGEKEIHLERLQKYLKVKDELWEQTKDDAWAQYKDATIADSSYGYWMNQYAAEEEERQRFIEDIMDDRKPDGAYIILSYLIEKHLFTNILTTNFDDLINEAVMYYTNVRCRFYVDDELSQYISIHSKKPNIVKLHGDYRFANMKNTGVETERLTANIGKKLDELLQKLGLVVVGYNGADYSIMSVLQQYKDRKYPLIWCGMDAGNVHWRVAQLINETENSYFVEIKGFDWLMGKLLNQFLGGVIPDVVEKAKEKKEIIDAFLRDFKKRFEETAAPEEAAKLDKTIDKWALLNKARENNDHRTIIDIETEIIDSGKGDANDYHWRGWAYNELKEHQKAIDDYNKAIELHPTNATTYNNRGLVYNNLKEYQRAVDDLSKTIELDPNNATAYNNRGAAYNELKEYQKAIDDCNKAIELKPDSPNPYKHRGVAYAALQRYDEAGKDLDKAIALKPDYLAAYEARAALYEQTGEQEKAKADQAKAEELKKMEE